MPPRLRKAGSAFPPQKFSLAFEARPAAFNDKLFYIYY